MFREPSFTPNEEERALFDSDPEECFRHAVRRGAISLDEATAHLSPRIAAMVRTIASGERLAVPDLARTRSMDAQTTPPDPSQPREYPRERTTAQTSLAHHPQLAQMLDERILTAEEALETAQAMDDALGRYLTGTRYAAP